MLPQKHCYILISTGVEQLVHSLQQHDDFYACSNRAIVIPSVYFFKMTKYQFLILVLLTIFLNGTTFVIGMLLRLM